MKRSKRIVFTKKLYASLFVLAVTFVSVFYFQFALVKVQASGNSQITFQSAIRYNAFGNTNVFSSDVSMATDDINKDNKLDLIAVGDHIVSVLLNDGSGNFTNPRIFFGVLGASSVAVTDLNHDSNKDLAVVSTSLNKVSILFGDGTGNFSSPIHFSVGSNPQKVVTGDLNNDGNEDLVISNRSSQDVSLLFGNGVGGFGSSAFISPVCFTDALFIADFINDGY